MYKNHAGWKWQPNLCPADEHFIDYLRWNKVTSKFIFHLGPGLHHQVGLHATNMGNKVLTLTVSGAEDSVYDKMLDKRWQDTEEVPYLCNYEDVYDFEPRNWVKFDYVTLFHLGEMDDRDPKYVLKKFADHLNEDGRLLLYTGSSAWDRIDGKTAELRLLTFEGQHKSLEIWRKSVVFVS